MHSPTMPETEYEERNADGHQYPNVRSRSHLRHYHRIYDVSARSVGLPRVEFRPGNIFGLRHGKGGLVMLPISRLHRFILATLWTGFGIYWLATRGLTIDGYFIAGMAFLSAVIWTFFVR